MQEMIKTINLEKVFSLCKKAVHAVNTDLNDVKQSIKNIQRE